MRILTVLAAALAALLAGCAGNTVSEIEATDRGVFLPSGRVAIDISPRGETPSRPHSGHSIEIDATGGEGSDTQELAAGELPAVFGGRTFNSPTQLTHDFEFRFGEIAYRYRHFFGDGSFAIEALGGLGYAELDLTVASATQRANEKIGNGGLVGAFGVVWNFWRDLSLQSRITLFASGEDEGVNAASRFDLYVAYAFARNLAVRAGVSSWTVRSSRQAEDDLSPNSPITVRFSGPALGLELMF